MIHVTIGDGPGKTTAAVGLAVRAAGRGQRVLFVQFLKDDTSGEIPALRKLETVTVLHAPVHHGFLSRMTAEQRQETAAGCRTLLETAASLGTAGKPDGYRGKARPQIPDRKPGRAYAEPGPGTGEPGAQPGTGEPGADLVILDEVLHALDAGLVHRADLEPILNRDWEVVLTGRTAPDWLLIQADYVSEVRKRKHPFDRGVRAREGIEF